MDRIINQEQINQIQGSLIQANIPVQIFMGIQKLFQELPLSKEDKGDNKDGDKP